MYEPKVEIIKDSIGPSGVRLTTLVLEYPRIIHGELLTHRLFSRNASSSRAVKFSKMVERIERDMFVPQQFLKRHTGMRGDEFFTGWRQTVSEKLWRFAGKSAIACAKRLDRIGITKQISNRLLESFSTIKVVVTATEWGNFLTLRNHPDAEIHIQSLARKIQEALGSSTPQELEEGEWHLPFIKHEDHEYVKNIPTEVAISTLIKISSARCARVSYLNFYGKNDYNADLRLYDQLITNKPMHASPIEHQAQALSHKYHECHLCEFDLNQTLPKGLELRITDHTDWHSSNLPVGRKLEVWSGNLKGWIQYRKVMELS
jgi:hypothetical protein